ncbi:MAG: DUF4440 domain-containing protein [Gemmatimonadetes bacterium]|nr:MAG: DUF4440 domain-containing protein [Gemmatimonadota bacterium]
MTFTDTLNQHLDAIRTRNITAFLATVIEDDSLNLILPNGAWINNRADFVKFHEEWFSDTEWHAEFEVLSTIERNDMAQALVQMDYSDMDPEGEEYHATIYLGLVFLRQKEQWVLIHSQNTPIQDEEEE